MYKKILLIGALCASIANADDSLAKKSQNPVGNMYSVPLEYWHHNGIAEDGEGAANMAILKPVIPVSVGDYNLINRFIIPYVGIDPHNGGDLGNVILPSSDTKESGLANIQYQGIFSPKKPGSVIYGLGAVVEFPTHSKDLGSDNYSAGPVFLALTMPGNWVFGTLVQNVWSIGGSSNPDDDINSLLWQYFVNYNFSNGWYATSTPIMTADWNAPSGEKWTVPLGGGIGKMMKFDNFPPLDFKLQAFSNVVKPTGGADWQMFFVVKLILPKQMFGGSK
ncbi:MAG: neuromedin U [Epsilonproteobacteria bacterium]|nr:MAG: neuromedin U [Campylobacterota bacterium]